MVSIFFRLADETKFSIFSLRKLKSSGKCCVEWAPAWNSYHSYLSVITTRHHLMPIKTILLARNVNIWYCHPKKMRYEYSSASITLPARPLLWSRAKSQWNTIHWNPHPLSDWNREDANPISHWRSVKPEASRSNLFKSGGDFTHLLSVCISPIRYPLVLISRYCICSQFAIVQSDILWCWSYAIASAISLPWTIDLVHGPGL